MITDVRFGHRQGWPLELRLERNGSAIDVVFQDAVRFRAHDESEIIGHWLTRAEEGVDVGTIYAIESSTYKDELASGAAALVAPLTHFLVAGYDLCVEVLSTSPPTISKAHCSSIGVDSEAP